MAAPRCARRPSRRMPSRMRAIPAPSCASQATCAPWSRRWQHTRSDPVRALVPTPSPCPPQSSSLPLLWPWQAGFSAKKARAAGYTASEASEAGWSIEALKNAGYSARELKEEGKHGASELRAVGFELSALRSAGCKPQHPPRPCRRATLLPASLSDEVSYLAFVLPLAAAVRIVSASRRLGAGAAGCGLWRGGAPGGGDLTL